MAGETVKTRAVCLTIHPWSRTSHVTTWLTPHGVVATLVKGAVRPKSAFLGQYDLNYTCEILYYARSRGDLHALRECTPVERRDWLRGDFRAMALSDWFRRLAMELAPTGPEAAAWMAALEEGLGESEAMPKVEGGAPRIWYLQRLIDYETKVLDLAGLRIELTEEDGVVKMSGERSIPVTEEIRRCLGDPYGETDEKILVDTARVIFVYYTFHVDCAPEVRRTVMRMILQ